MSIQNATTSAKPKATNPLMTVDPMATTPVALSLAKDDAHDSSDDWASSIHWWTVSSSSTWEYWAYRPLPQSMTFCTYTGTFSTKLENCPPSPNAGENKSSSTAPSTTKSNT